MWRYNPASRARDFIAFFGLFSGAMCLVIFSPNKLTGQTYNNPNVYIDLSRVYSLINWIPDSTLSIEEVNSWISGFRKKGYLQAGLDSIVIGKDSQSIFLVKGKKFHQRLKVYRDSVELMTSEQTNYFSQLSSSLEFDSEDELVGWLEHFCELGFPFIQARLDSLTVIDDSLVTVWTYKLADYIIFEKPEQASPEILADKAFQRLADIKPGQSFSIGRIKKAQTAFAQLPFVDEEAEPALFFLGDVCKPRFYLKKRSASSFDFLLGLNQVQGQNGTSYQLTGTASIDLLNVFKWTESIKLVYENLQDRSPRFLLDFNFPLIPSFPVGLGMHLSLYRYKEEYFQLKNSWKLIYGFEGNQKIGLTFDLQQSSLLNTDTLYIVQTGKLPATLDFKTQSIGLFWEYSNLDNLRNPTKGQQFEVRVSYGNKKYPENNSLLKYDDMNALLQKQYDSLNNHQQQAEFQFRWSHYRKLGKRQVLKFAAMGMGIVSDLQLRKNERFLLGGMKNLRGFDEDFLRASQYGILTFEYRWLVGLESYFSVFNDLAALNQESGERDLWYVYNGAGAGVHLHTLAGNFGLYFALGASRDQAFEWKSGKVHFGYNTLF